MSTVEREKLPLDAFPENLRQHVEPDAPEDLKKMAAQGMIPAPPEQTLRVLYQLHFEAEGDLEGDIAEAIGDMPTNVVAGAGGDEEHPGVLDWIAEHRGGDEAVVEALLRNDAAEDMTFADLASRVDTEICDLIATNEVRVLRTPEIIEELYQNPNARMATVNQLVDLARDNDVELPNLPGVERAADRNPEAFNQEEPSEGEEVFQEILEQESERAEEEREQLEQLDDEDLTRSQREKLREEIEEDDDERETGQIRETDLMDMSVAEKIRLATVGSRSTIKKLCKDPNRQVHMAAIESPQLKTPDALRLASKKNIPDGVLEYIARNREWTQKYDVVKNLVFNPKTPVNQSMDLVKRLRRDDLKKLQNSREVPHQVSRAAKRLLKKRRGGGGGRRR
ncbi:MAG: hypothetical protein ABEL76_04815 [Bradymonadaceae bacterium]